MRATPRTGMCCLGLALASSGCPEPLVLTSAEQSAGAVPGTPAASDPAPTPPLAATPVQPSSAAASVPVPLETSRCGSRGARCCAEPEPACAPNLRCDDATESCVLESSSTDTPQLCQRDSDCSAGETCCPPSRVFRSCLRLEPGGNCPLPDLSVFVPAALNVLIDEPLITPGQAFYYNNLNYAPTCILEKACVGGPGSRRLLHFQAHVVNLGEADLVLGANGVTPEVQFASCNSTPYVQNYLRYELVGSDDRVVAHSDGGMPPPVCSGYALLNNGGRKPRFNCGFLGVETGRVETFTNTDECQWIDILGVPGGEYRLRVTVNPERVWLESDYTNNSIEVPISLPSFDLTAACPPQGQAPLGYQYNNGDYWCGWSAAGVSSSCSPGQAVQLGCPTCSGDPALRVCEGSETCTRETSLAWGSDTYVEEGGRLGPCYGGLCEFVSYCPTVNFVCPPSGKYTWLTRDEIGSPSSCDLEPIP